MRLLVRLTTRHGGYRRGLVHAASTLTREEAAVLADLEAHGPAPLRAHIEEGAATLMQD